MSDGTLDKSCLAKNLREGFSLLEVLLVVAIIGILASVALPNISNVRDASKISVARHTARNTAEVFVSGLAAGAPKFKAASSVLEAQTAVFEGDYGAAPFKEIIFQLPRIAHAADESQTEARHKPSYYLRWSNGRLAYDPAGGHTN